LYSSNTSNTLYPKGFCPGHYASTDQLISILPTGLLQLPKVWRPCWYPLS
jgi:hypothetical protein